MKQFLFALAWLLLSSGIIFTTIASHQYILYSNRNSEIFQSLEDQSLLIATGATQEGEVAGVSTGVETKDARALLVTNFLKRHNSPMEPHEQYGQMLVAIADQHEIDFRLLPAIAMQESNLCKVIPEGTYNCLGLGIHAKGTWGFNSYQENFTAAAKILKKNYIDIGLTTPEQIMRKYTPGSNGSWASSVNQWMAEMRYDDRQSGRDMKMNADLTEFVGSSDSSVQAPLMTITPRALPPQKTASPSAEIIN